MGRMVKRFILVCKQAVLTIACIHIQSCLSVSLLLKQVSNFIDANVTKMQGFAKKNQPLICFVQCLDVFFFRAQEVSDNVHI